MREVNEIYEELLDSFTQRAGYRPENDCDLAVRLYAAAAQIQALEIQAEWVLAQSFPQTARGEQLDSHAWLRGITRLAAAPAAGILRFEVDTAPVSALVIPAGTVCMTADNVRFRTTAQAVLAVGETFVETAAEALEPGRGGNVSARAITLMSAMPGGVLRCTNPEPFSGGTDAEDDESLRARILESYQRLPNGANAAFYEQTAMSHEGVAAAVAVGRARGIGTVDVCVAAPGGLPSAELLAEVEADLQAKREIAVDVDVIAPTVRTVDITAALAVEEGADFAAVEAAAEAALTNWFTGQRLGKSVLLAELGDVLYHVEGVKNFHITAPAADWAGETTTLPMLGTLTLTELA